MIKLSLITQKKKFWSKFSKQLNLKKAFRTNFIKIYKYTVNNIILPLNELNLN